MKAKQTAAMLLYGMALASQAAPASGQRQPLEPLRLPPAVEQGVDMVYIDREIGVDIRWRNTKLDNVTFARYAGAPLDLVQAINPLYTQLRRGLVRYQQQWSSLPQFRLDLGPALAMGAEGDRVTLLRERLGLEAGTASTSRSRAALSPISASMALLPTVLPATT
jgi:hypothetical protein